MSKQNDIKLEFTDLGSNANITLDGNYGVRDSPLLAELIATLLCLNPCQSQFSMSFVYAI